MQAATCKIRSFPCNFGTVKQSKETSRCTWNTRMSVKEDWNTWKMYLHLVSDSYLWSGILTPFVILVYNQCLSITFVKQGPEAQVVKSNMRIQQVDFFQYSDIIYLQNNSYCFKCPVLLAFTLGAIITQHVLYFQVEAITQSNQTVHFLTSMNEWYSQYTCNWIHSLLIFACNQTITAATIHKNNPPNHLIGPH